MCSSNDHQLSMFRHMRLAGLCVLSLPFCFISALAAETRRVPEQHTTIQSAIDVAQAGDTILVAAGTYKERIKLKAGLILKSVGDDTKGTLGLKRAEATIIDGGGEQGTGAGVTMAERSTLDGFTVTNVGVYDENEWNRHHATHGEQQAHEMIGAPGTAGISVTGVSCSIQNNIVHHIGYTGIAVQNVAGKNCSPHVYRNVCYRNMGGGIGSMYKSTALIEENICFQNFYAGIGHDDASPTVINNLCYENIRAGIGISEGSQAIVRGNKCHHNRRAGIGVRTGSNTRPLIEHNDCYTNDMAGIGAREEAAPLIRRNRCYQNKLAGIGSRTGATPTIVDNECFENGQSGISQQSDAVTILINNFCHHNQTSGVGFAATKAGRSTLIKNRITDNAQVAIGVNAGWTVTLVGNELARQGGMPPVMMVFPGSEVTLTGNIIRGGGVAGIRVGGKIRASNNEFAGTTLRKVGPPNFGVWALSGADVSLTDNQFHDWRHALQADKATVFAARNRISNFHGTALVIRNAPAPANVFYNIAVSANPNDKVVSISGETGVVQNNELQKPVD